MTAYLRNKFTVDMGASQRYQDNWEAIFRPDAHGRREGTGGLTPSPVRDAKPPVLSRLPCPQRQLEDQENNQ